MVRAAAGGVYGWRLVALCVWLLRASEWEAVQVVHGATVGMDYKCWKGWKV